MARDEAARDATEEASLVDRRTYMKLFGVAATPVAASGATAESASAESSTGFGVGGYGDGEYGGTATESALAVTTAAPTDVTGSEATLNAEVTDLGGASSVEVRFEYRRAGASRWTATESRSLSAVGSASVTVGDLQSGAEYEYRAAVAASDGDTATGSTRTFATRATANPPVIDRFEVSESGLRNPHAEISATWQVSDADADLRKVAVEVRDADGRVRRSTSVGVSGESASGAPSFRIKKGGGAAYDCVLEVTDATGRTTSRTRTVTA